MNRLVQTTFERRASLIRCAMMGALVVALTMPPTDARASGYYMSTGQAVLLLTGLLVVGGMGVASGVVLISDGVDLFGEPEPTAWNAGWDLGLGVSNGALCTLGWIYASPQDDEAIGATIAACAASALLLSHGFWELSLLEQMDPSDQALEDGVTMSFGPTVLDAKGAFGLGMVGRF